VISNGGGNLFRFIAGPSEVEELDEFFEAAQDLDIEKLVATYGLNYLKAENESELNYKLIDLYSSQDIPTVLEVKTPRIENDKILKKYFQALKQSS
jgi:2-succinyl-5-enolpyruvyl-6-hydroxy-3-cyclohexene-1-carboxylate synthase